MLAINRSALAEAARPALGDAGFVSTSSGSAAARATNTYHPHRVMPGDAAET
jgi:hypothetical protein